MSLLKITTVARFAAALQYCVLLISLFAFCRHLFDNDRERSWVGMNNLYALYVSTACTLFLMSYIFSAEGFVCCITEKVLRLILTIASSISQRFDYYLLHGFSIDNVSTKKEILYTVHSSDVKRKRIVLHWRCCRSKD
jgi:hypothetical protein